MRILVVEDVNADAMDTQSTLETLGYSDTFRVSSRSEAIEVLRSDKQKAEREEDGHLEFGAAIVDWHLPGSQDGPELVAEIRRDFPRPVPIYIIMVSSNAYFAKDAIRLGANDFLEKPLRVKQYLVAACLERAEQLAERERRHRDERQILIASKAAGVDFVKIGLDETMRRVSKVSHLDSTVLIQGERGTGKELIARTIHDFSPRKDQPYVEVNCGAIEPSMLMSELFGHKKGAFTGAIRDRKGFFEQAHAGTIFLDEVGDLTAEAQTALLRTIQFQTVRPLGAEKAITVDVRVLAATNKHLGELVDQKTFRGDLFDRLHVIPIHVPPLRDRREAIPELARRFYRHFLRKHSLDLEPVLPNDTIEFLKKMDWPGNVRELLHAIERATSLAEPGSSLSIKDFASQPQQTLSVSTRSHPRSGTLPSLPFDLDDWIASFQAWMFRQTLRTYKYKGEAAASVGLPPQTFASRIEALEKKGYSCDPNTPEIDEA